MTTESQAALAKLAADTKAVCATSADVAQAANPAAKVAAKGVVYHAKVAVLVHSIYLAAAGGVIVGIVACHLANKYWLNKNNTVKS